VTTAVFLHFVLRNREITSKQIYEKLVGENVHVPSAIARFSQMRDYLANLPRYYFLDPYLRQFLFKFYHCRLYFKRYQININDMLNFGQRCLLCNNAIDTPKHLFDQCKIGEIIRSKRDTLISNFHHVSLSDSENVYSYLSDYNGKEVTHFMITLCNYSIYKTKMKKFFDPNYMVSNQDPLYSFINNLKVRIICDHKRLSLEKFRYIWDPHNTEQMFNYNQNNILSWFI